MTGINNFGKVEYNFSDFKNAVSENLGEELKGALDRNLSEVQSVFDLEAGRDGGEKDDLLEVNSLLLKHIVNKATLKILQNLKKEQDAENKSQNKKTVFENLKNEAMKNFRKLELVLLRENEIKLDEEKLKDLQEKENPQKTPREQMVEAETESFKEIQKDYP